MVIIEIASIQVLTERREQIFQDIEKSRRTVKKSEMSDYAVELIKIEDRLRTLGVEVLGHENNSK